MCIKMYIRLTNAIKWTDWRVVHGMAGFKLTVGFLFVFVCFASVPSVNGKPRSSTI